jgi:hypothetical protein
VIASHNKYTGVVEMSELACLFRAEIIVHTGEGDTRKPLRLNADDIVKYFPLLSNETMNAEAKSAGKCLSKIYYAHAGYEDYDHIQETDEEIAALIDAAEIKRAEKVKKLKFGIS